MTGGGVRVRGDHVLNHHHQFDTQAHWMSLPRTRGMGQRHIRGVVESEHGSLAGDGRVAARGFPHDLEPEHLAVEGGGARNVGHEQFDAQTGAGRFLALLGTLAHRSDMGASTLHGNAQGAQQRGRTMSETDLQILQVETFGKAQRVTLNRPDRLNALNQPLTDALLAHFEGLRRNRDVGVVLLRGAGRAFCAGADLKALNEPDRLQDGPRGDWVLRDLMKAMRACPQPIIAQVQGAAAGGGLALALASDVIVAADDASFHSAFIRVGLSGAELGASWRLQRTIGVSRAREMLLSGRPMPAAEALQAGLAARVVAREELDGYAMALAEDMLGAETDALRLTKRSLDATLECPSVDAAMEIEERAQMLMIARRSAPA